ncbi:hypothetical protein SUGI_0498390 [Cryptomeria japonica]|nr:hypothetical protein SUGI_0498390 [Cryptomeria japonica]
MRSQIAMLRALSFKRSNLRSDAEISNSFDQKDSDVDISDSHKPKGSDAGISESLKQKESDVASVGSEINKEKDVDAAALTVQKVYRSYRTRRNLADCVVVAEELWWQAIDFVTQERKTVSFFDIGKPETAVSRWSRAGLKAAKVGKGLSKDENARKLAFQHWMEAIDPRHRYGHNLHFYYDAWFESDTKEPFFYWLDIGDGKSLDLQNVCPRSKLQKERIKYLGPKEREQYEFIPQDGKLVYKQNGQLLDTRSGSERLKWIFVMSTSKKLYVGQKKKGTFQHSSFLAGGATSAAGRFRVEDGILKAIWPHSGHYLPTEQNFTELLNFLEGNGIDLSNVEKGTYEVDSPELERDKSRHTQKLEGNVQSEVCIENNTTLCEHEQNADEGKSGDRFMLSQLENPSEISNSNASAQVTISQESSMIEQSTMGTETITTGEQKECQESVPCNISMLEDLEIEKPEVPHTALLKRFNSKRAIQSYQLGKQLSLKWSSGAGPRIGCVADYPAELRAVALERVNLSPRCASPSNYKLPECATAQLSDLAGTTLCLGIV